MPLPLSDMSRMLRMRAEQSLRDELHGREQEVGDAADPRVLLRELLMRELRVHEIELSMQNEALQEANARLEQSHAKYRELYEQAPVAYLTVGKNTAIHDVNAAAAKLLRATPHELLGVKLSTFVVPEHAILL